jgi:tyrosinase
MERYATPDDKPFAVPVWEGQPDFYRADLHFHRVEHRGDSYEGRVFFDRPEAGAETPLETGNGYAGSFYVFGHGPCFGDEGHCEVPAGPIHPFDYRAPHQLNPQLMVVTVTEALRRVIEEGRTEFHVYVVPVAGPNEPAGDVLRFEELSLVTYD